MNRGDKGDEPRKIHVLNTPTEMAKHRGFFLRIATVGSLEN